MRTLALVLASTGMIAGSGCGGGKPAPQPVSNQQHKQEVEVTEAETMVAELKKSEDPALARAQAVEQARKAGILGKGSGAAPSTNPDEQGGEGTRMALEEARRSGAPPAATTPPAGPLDKATIRRELNAHRREITRCYEQRLLEDDTLQGTVNTTFLIGADGKVTTAAASGFDTQVDECIVEVLRRMVFPAPDGGGVVKVSYPLIFKQGGG
jgi:outer membrane biosynthesis protein TonB